MYANFITYHPRWDTPENIAAAKRALALADEMGANCSGICPPAWGAEVCALLLWIRQKYPDTQIGQIKEKLGTLRVYFDLNEYPADARDRIREDIDKEICRTEIRLAIKGAFIPLANLLDAVVERRDPIFGFTTRAYPYREIYDAEFAPNKNKEVG